jgi:hypothetical protein
MNEMVQSPTIGEPVKGAQSISDAMRAAIERRDVPDIEKVFARAKEAHDRAAGSEIYFKEKKDVANQLASYQKRLRTERLMGRWLIELAEKKLRYMGRPSEGTKVGTPTDPNIITLEKLGVSRKESQEWRALARMPKAEFEALLSNPKLTTAPLGRQFSKKSQQNAATGVPVRKGEIRLLSLSAIRVDERAQPRVQMDEDRIAEYAEEMRRGCKFPPW